MSYTIIKKIEGMKLGNGKVIPFIQSASNNVRDCNNALCWGWDNLQADKGKSFMFEKPEELIPQIEALASLGCWKYVNGGYINLEGMMRKLTKAFRKPTLAFHNGEVSIDYCKVGKDKTKVTHVTFKPHTEEELVSYMEENKQRSLRIRLI